jgi:hypothetical protein
VSRVVVLLAVAACGPSGDPLDIHYTYAIEHEQACLAEDGDPVESCMDIPMTCDSVGMLRIVDAEDPEKVYVNVCKRIDNGSPRHDLCPIVDALEAEGSFPTSRVAVQIAVYPLASLPRNPAQEPICPDNIKFTASGFAAPTNMPQPALAGMAYTDGYDSEVTVELGCNDTGLIDTLACRNENALDITASVTDFDNQLSVTVNEAVEINVRVGEPKPVGTEWVLDALSSADLPLQDEPDPNPIWAADNLDIELVDYACLQVVDFSDDRATPAITCRPLTAPVPTMLDLSGIRVRQGTGDTLEDILGALGLGEFPGSGLVIGKVVEAANIPVPGATVSDSAGSPIAYLSADGMSVGGASTSTNGIFIATTAPFEIGTGAANHWTASAPQKIQLNDPIGGQIKTRLMVVIIQMGQAF